MLPDVRIAGDPDGPAWQAYLQRTNGAGVFHRWQWRAILAESFGHRAHWLVAERDGRIVGVLPLAEVRTPLFGHKLVSLPFCSWAGPLADDAQALEALDARAVELGNCLGVRHIEYRQQSPHFDRATQDLYVMFARDIVADDAVNFAAIPRKQRAMIRKAASRGLTADAGSLDEFQVLYADNMHRHGTPACPKHFFAAMQRHFGDDCQILVVRDGRGRAVSGVLSLYHDHEVLPFYAGDLPRARELAANDFKYWRLMQQAAARGCTRFNFGRSKRGAGSHAFKKHWGFVETSLHYQYWLCDGRPLAQLNPANPRFRLAIDLWKRLPRAAVDLAGPWLVRGLG